MEKMCPITLNSVNERVAQINALLSVVFVLLFLFTPYKWLIAFLVIDFFIRGFLNPAHSYFSAASKGIARLIKIKPVMVDSGPKIFAAKIGFVFCCILALLELFGYHSASIAVGSVFMLFAGMEAMFRFCVACKLYPFIHRLKKSH